MLDYKSIEILYTVIEKQSFEIAAKHLHLTQSAISQRIKNLENHHGQPLLIRSLPYKATNLGEQLIGHFKKVCLLEEHLKKQLNPETTTPRISIALNRDSLETWFLNLVEKELFFKDFIIEIISDDQELTYDYFKKGLVSACASTSNQKCAHSHVTFLGNMDYSLVAAPNFYRKHFSNQKLTKGLLEAPALRFDKNDHLHADYLEKFFHIKKAVETYHLIPSVQGFKKYVLAGYGYALLPKIDINEELNKQTLIELCPEKIWQVPLFWHHWEIQSEFYQNVNHQIIHYAQTLFQKSAKP